jgi:hypothetical protein
MKFAHAKNFENISLYRDLQALDFLLHDSAGIMNRPVG